jgi:arsenite-transporting ATPase
VDALRALLIEESSVVVADEGPNLRGGCPEVPGFERMIQLIAAAGRGLIMVMGKGGVGKTTVAAACTVGLVARGFPVHLTTTYPAAHLALTREGEVPELRVGRIDPKRKPQDT